MQAGPKYKEIVLCEFRKIRMGDGMLAKGLEAPAKGVVRDALQVGVWCEAQSFQDIRRWSLKSRAGLFPSRFGGTRATRPGRISPSRQSKRRSCEGPCFPGKTAGRNSCRDSRRDSSAECKAFPPGSQHAMNLFKYRLSLGKVMEHLRHEQ